MILIKQETYSIAQWVPQQAEGVSAVDSETQQSSPHDASDTTSQPPKGDWRVWSVVQSEGKDGVPDIEFNVFPWAKPKEAEMAFVTRAEATLTAIRTIYPIDKEDSKGRHEEIHRRILRASRLGLARENPALDAANLALDQIRDQVLSLEAGRIKNGYMIRLGRWAIFLCICSLIIAIAATAIIPNTYHFFSKMTSSVRMEMLCYVWSGSMVGAWASFAIRKPDFTFDDLTIIEKDHVDPPLRLIFCGILTVVLCLIFTTGLADIVIGSFKASDIANSDTSAWLVGLLCGISEMALPSIVSQRAASFINNNTIS